MVDKEILFSKVIGMFRPCRDKFLSFPPEDVVCGPNDRAIFGGDTYFPIEWLIEDFDFTEEEAREFIKLVLEHDKG